MNAALQEHLDHEFSARYDYLSEAFGDEARLLDAQARDEREQEELEAQQAWEAFIGPRIPQMYAEPIGPSLEEDLPF